MSRLQEVYFLWRPTSGDRADDMLLELAVAARAEYIITHNVRDFRWAVDFGIIPIRPGEFLNRTSEAP